MKTDVENEGQRALIGIDHSNGKDETVAVVRMGQKVADVGKVVGMVTFKDRLFVALEFAVYELVGDELVKIERQEIEG